MATTSDHAPTPAPTASQQSALASFPVELLKLIATHLPTLSDTLAFASTSRRFYSAVNSDSTVYRQLFLDLYDPPIPSLSSLCYSSPISPDSAYDYKSAYISRHLLLHSLRTATQPPDMVHLALLRTLILEAMPPHSKNLCKIIPQALPAYIISGGATSFAPKPRLLLALELLIHPVRRLTKSEVERVRRSAYATSRLHDEWLNLGLLNSIALLTGYHLDKDMNTGVYYQANILTPEEMPGWWTGRLGDILGNRFKGAPGQTDPDVGEIVREEELGEMPVRWFGAYTFKVYNFMVEDGQAGLRESGDDFLSELALAFDKRGRFSGEGKDFKNFKIQHGVVGEPVEVEGIPGWRKVTFVKNYETHMWEYVGALLPGKNMIIGRWAAPGSVMSGGIFMWWAVPKDGPDLGSRDNRLSLIP